MQIFILELFRYLFSIYSKKCVTNNKGPGTNSGVYSNLDVALGLVSNMVLYVGILFNNSK